ncbi:receptor-type tyrosine-protein phosphatase kappa-like [Mya arenaria]|nr:receptor-type tyrosine-protein phosphatase kappa-like [Mya arenaria]
MIFWIFGLLCMVQSCMAVFINGLDCRPACVCCEGGKDQCGSDVRHGNNFCLDGCIDGIYGWRCHNACPGNCSACEQEDGRPCYSCKATFYDTGSECSKSCPVGCDGGVCNDEGACSKCTANFEGTKCNMCVQGKYGSDCTHYCISQNCRCSNGTDCTSCKTGFYGSRTLCQTPCSPGCQDDVCYDNGSCNCLVRFTGNTCSECQSGYYGPYCNISCSVGCVNGLCEKNGTCSCHPNFYTNKCDTCVDRKYGEICNQTCSVGCTTSFCDRTNGHCECLPNFSGNKCDQCKSGFYDQSCNLHCSDNCIGDICSRYQGKCTLGCVDGYSGDNCTTHCDKPCASCLQSERSYCESCHNGYSGPTCRCPPNCKCSVAADVCTSCKDGYVNTGKQCMCQSQYCSETECDRCVNQTFYVDDNACCECPGNCKDGTCKSGPECIYGCIDGFYGRDCSQSCSFLNDNCKRCNQTYGKCLECNMGFYPHDNGSCISCNSNCLNGHCSSNIGTCLIGCKDTFWGDKCDIQCNLNCETCAQDSGNCNLCIDRSFHGRFCNESCSAFCFERKCDKGTGHCLNGCNGTFYGNLCKTHCPANCKESGAVKICNDDGNCKYGCVDGYEGNDCSRKTDGSLVGAIAGAVSGGVVLIVAVAVAFFFFRRRTTRKPASSQNKGNGNVTFQPSITDEKNKKSQDRTYYNEGQVKRESTKPIPTISRPPANKPNAAKHQVSTHEETAFESEIDLEIDDERNGALENSSRGDQTYYNELGSSTIKSKVHINQLVKYVDGKTYDAFSAEFEKFSSGLVKPYVESQKRENMSKNRYKGIYPYDDSRVKVTSSGGSDYINASFIDGYKKPKQYIATLGPMSQQLDDFSLFWKMIWQQRVEKIVMVTNLIEHGTPKCEQYWPNPGVSKMYGEIKVESRSEDEYAEFTRRALTMTMGTEERTLHHLHFTCWPDKAIPDDVTAMIEFRQRVQSTPSTLNGPTVVHCSAGVGRTGTYIALDILTKEGEAERAIDIAGCVHKMRLNRPNMVQTVEQYQFLHTAVVYSLTFDCKQIKGENFDQFMKQHTSKELNSQFKRLQHTVEKRTKDEAIAVERNKQHLSKNRANADIPGNENRPRLYLNLKHGASDYINAVYIHSFRIKKRNLVAQTPLPETVIDFLTLVVQESCSCIVSFEADMDKQRNIGIYYPAANQDVLKQGTFQVSCSREEKKTFYAERTLTIQHKGVGTSTERTIPHLQYTDWDETNNIPRSTTNFLSFLNVIENVTKQSGDGPILVHCLDGAGKSGLFCVVSLLLHKMAVEHEVSVLNSVRKVKTMRRLAIPNQEQFSFCHGCVSEYLSSFDVYANFNEETGRL